MVTNEAKPKQARGSQHSIALYKDAAKWVPCCWCFWPQRLMVKTHANKLSIFSSRVPVESCKNHEQNNNSLFRGIALNKMTFLVDSIEQFVSGHLGSWPGFSSDRHPFQCERVNFHMLSMGRRNLGFLRLHSSLVTYRQANDHCNHGQHSVIVVMITDNQPSTPRARRGNLWDCFKGSLHPILSRQQANCS